MFSGLGFRGLGLGLVRVWEAFAISGVLEARAFQTRLSESWYAFVGALLWVFIGVVVSLCCLEVLVVPGQSDVISTVIGGLGTVRSECRSTKTAVELSPS